MKFKAIALSLIFGSLFCGCTSENVFDSASEVDGLSVDIGDSASKTDASKLNIENIEGFSQKGPVLAGASVVVQELDSATLMQTGKSFRGKVVNDNGEFVVDNMHLEYPYVLLEVNGYFRNEITGKNSEGPVFMKSLADVSEKSQVNVNLLTHLEYERVQVLMQSKMSIAEAKRIADREIFSAFYEDDDYGKVENLDIFGNSKGDAALLAINVLLLGRGDEASFMESFAKLGDDLAADGVWSDSLFKARIADDACEMDLDNKLPAVRKNIENWKISKNVSSFEPYISSFWENVYGLGACNASNLGAHKRNSNVLSDFYNVEFVCDKSERWVVNLDSVRAGCDSCGFIVDSRDGRKYRTVKMAGSKWMAENLAYDGYGEGSLYYDDESYGLLYSITLQKNVDIVQPNPNVGKWTYNFYLKNGFTPMAMYLHTSCPDGWRLPTSGEMTRLIEVASENNFERLLSKRGWNLQLGRSGEEITFLTSTLDSVTFYGQIAQYSLAKMSVSGSRNSPIVKMSGSLGGEGFMRCVEDEPQKRDTLPASEVVLDSFVDARDGKMYKALKFGSQEWMAQNVAYVIGDSLLDDRTYRYWGILKDDLAMPYLHHDIGWRYNWQEVQNACPGGWRIPSVDDAKEMLKLVGGGSGNAPLFTSGLKDSQDIYGFTALPSEYERGGCTKAVNGCAYGAVGAKFWISDSTNDGAKVLSFDSKNVNIQTADAAEYLPVRCVKEAE